MSAEDQKIGKKKPGKPRQIPTEDILRQINELKQEQGRLPTSAEIASRLGITKGMVDNYIWRTPEIRAQLPGRRRGRSLPHEGVVSDFVSGKTQQEIGERDKVTRQAVHRREKNRGLYRRNPNKN